MKTICSGVGLHRLLLCRAERDRTGGFDGASSMILPLRGGYEVLSRVKVTGFPCGIRLFQARYGGTCCSSSSEMDGLLRRALPAGTRWHAACLGAGWQANSQTEECARCRRSLCSPSGGERYTCGIEVLWTDVLVDFGGVPVRTAVDFKSAELSFRGRVANVRACSGVGGDVLAERWVCPWGGPFGRAYDREVSMLVAPIVVWRCGERILYDVGDEADWDIIGGSLCMRAVVDGE